MKLCSVSIMFHAATSFCSQTFKEIAGLCELLVLYTQ